MVLTLKLKHMFYYIVIFILISEEIFLAELTKFVDILVIWMIQKKWFF